MNLELWANTECFLDQFYPDIFVLNNFFFFNLDLCSKFFLTYPPHVEHTVKSGFCELAGSLHVVNDFVQV